VIREGEGLLKRGDFHPTKTMFLRGPVFAPLKHPARSVPFQRRGGKGDFREVKPLLGRWVGRKTPENREG